MPLAHIYASWAQEPRLSSGEVGGTHRQGVLTLTLLSGGGYALTFQGGERKRAPLLLSVGIHNVVAFGCKVLLVRRVYCSMATEPSR